MRSLSNHVSCDGRVAPPKLSAASLLNRGGGDDRSRSRSRSPVQDPEACSSQDGFWETGLSPSKDDALNRAFEILDLFEEETLNQLCDILVARRSAKTKPAAASETRSTSSETRSAATETRSAATETRSSVKRPIRSLLTSKWYTPRQAPRKKITLDKPSNAITPDPSIYNVLEDEMDTTEAPNHDASRPTQDTPVPKNPRHSPKKVQPKKVQPKKTHDQTVIINHALRTVTHLTMKDKASYMNEQLKQAFPNVIPTACHILRNKHAILVKVQTTAEQKLLADKNNWTGTFNPDIDPYIPGSRPAPIQNQATRVMHIPDTYSTEDIKESMELDGYDVIHIHRIRSAINNKPTKAVKVTLKTEEQAQHLSSRRLYMFHTGPFSVSLPHQKPSLTKCYRCNNFGHISTSCPNDQACPLCTLPHNVKDCPNRGTSTPTCILCKGNHVAGSLDCPNRLSAAQEMKHTEMKKTYATAARAVTNASITLQKKVTQQVEDQMNASLTKKIDDLMTLMNQLLKHLVNNTLTPQMIDDILPTQAPSTTLP